MNWTVRTPEPERWTEREPRLAPWLTAEQAAVVDEDGALLSEDGLLVVEAL